MLIFLDVLVQSLAPSKSLAADLTGVPYVHMDFAEVTQDVSPCQDLMTMLT